MAAVDASAQAPIDPPAPFCRTTPSPELLAQGAEALVYRTHHLSPSRPAILKYRPPKRWRHPTLDKRLTRHRILAEARTLVKCRREGVKVPGVIALDADGDKDSQSGGWMMMEAIQGKTVKEALQKHIPSAKNASYKQDRFPELSKERHACINGLMSRIGAAIGRLHKVGIIHGDLTTSNMMIQEEKSGMMPPDAHVDTESFDHAKAEHKNQAERNEIPDFAGSIVLIDFGLATQSLQDEDKAVDLYVLERAFASTHPELETSFLEVLTAYASSYNGAKIVLKRLEDVRMRGRKRSMLG